jgi:2-oxo-3-hexenedioate decarboxylase
VKLQEIADDIYHHQKKALELDRITSRYEGLTIEDAYEIQKINSEKDIQTGDHFVGWKMGLTSQAKQKSVGVDQPIYGRLLDSMKMNDSNLQLKGLIHPRVEPELAFLFNKKLEGANITEREVWQAIESITPALEIIDSRYKDFSFSLIDVVADNASSAKFLLSDQTYSQNQFEWDQIPVMMKLNDKTVQKGISSAVMGHPIQSVIELVQMLSRTGYSIEPGMVVLTGGITEAIHISSGDLLKVDFGVLGTMSLIAR